MLRAFVAAGQEAQRAVDRELERAVARAPAERQLLIPGTPPAALAAPRAARRRPARFKLDAGSGRRFDGASSATVTIAGNLISVRPRGRRRVFELAFADVVRGIIFDVTRAELAAKKRTKGGARRRPSDRASAFSGEIERFPSLDRISTGPIVVRGGTHR